MNFIDIPLSGRDATVAGITRLVHRQLDQGALARVELRYSTQSPEPLSPPAVQQALTRLLNENGLGNTAVSIRAHEGAIDDATGEHLLRLLPARPRPADASRETPQAPASGWRAWLARRFPRWFAPARPVAGQTPATQPAKAPDQPAVSRREAVAQLRKAVEIAPFLESETDTVVVVGRPRGQQVALVRIVVRLGTLHATLGPLVTSDPVRAAQSLAPMVRARGMAPMPGLRVTYAYLPRRTGDGTRLANECDLEVTLLPAPRNAADRIDPPMGDATASSAAASPSPQVDVGDGHGNLHGNHPGKDLVPVHQDTGTALACPTALPAPESPAGPALTVRVLGGLQQAFDQPFELNFATLPARLDRTALEQAGFGRTHAGLLAVFSNSCPLTIRQADGGGLVLHASTRSVPGQTDVPMYYHRDTLLGLKGEVSVTSGREQLVVNAPGGVHDPVTGRRLPALVIELLPARRSLGQSPLPVAA